MQRLDTYEKLPDGMREYISENGPHFNRKLCEWAVSRMRTEGENGMEKALEPWSDEKVREMLRNNSVEIRNDNGYDLCYAANMLKADFYKKSLKDESSLCMHLKLYLDDIDGDPCRAFDEFYGACIGKGVAIPWERML